MSENLETLLERLRGGQVRPGDLERARELVAADARVPADLRAEVFRSVDDTEADAAGLLSVLGHDDLGQAIAEAVGAEAFGAADLVLDGGLDDGWEAIASVLVEGLRAEAEGFEVAEGVVRRLPVAAFAHGSLVGDAVSQEAGGVEVADAVSANLGMADGVLGQVAAAVRAEAGTVDVAAAVAEALGFAEVPVAAAVRAEMGRVDVVPGVLAAVGAWRAEASSSDRVPAPANAGSSRFGFAGFALAAAVLVSVIVGRLVIPVGGGATDGLVFAHAGEVVVEDLQYGADVQVIQTEGDEGAVILWVDEEA